MNGARKTQPLSLYSLRRTHRAAPPRKITIHGYALQQANDWRYNCYEQCATILAFLHCITLCKPSSFNTENYAQNPFQIFSSCNYHDNSHILRRSMNRLKLVWNSRSYVWWFYAGSQASHRTLQPQASVVHYSISRECLSSNSVISNSSSPSTGIVAQRFHYSKTVAGLSGIS